MQREYLLTQFPELKTYLENKDIIEFRYTDLSIKRYISNSGAYKYSIWFKWIYNPKIYSIRLNVKEFVKDCYEITHVLLNGFRVDLGDASNYLPITPQIINQWINDFKKSS